MSALRYNDPDSISRMIIWLDGYRMAAHGPDTQVPYFSLIRRVLIEREKELRSKTTVE